MESIEARALKSSFLSQLTMKTNPQIFHNDDVWCLTKINSVAGADDFPVEDLLNLDLPEKEFQDFSVEDHQFPQNALSDNSSSAFTGADEVDNISSSAFNGSDEIDSLSELAVPVDDLENLEWLSQFVDDSTSGLSLLCPAGSFKPGGNSGKRAEQVNRPPQNIRAPRFPFPVQGKPRSKRSRKPSGRPWKLASPTLTPVDPSPSPSSSHGSSTLAAFVLENPVQDAYWFFSAEKPPAKRHRRKAEAEGVWGRRCTHCQVQKTPQWRTGPLGPKTLCNACGVRYKSGRLFPEYRPAFSPTFSHELHSNSHRKVLEMRRKKEMGEMVVGTGFPQVMWSS